MKKALTFLLVAVLLVGSLALCACDKPIEIDFEKALASCDKSIVLENATGYDKLVIKCDIYCVLVYKTEETKLTLHWTEQEKFDVTATDNEILDNPGGGQSRNPCVRITERKRENIGINFVFKALYLVVGVPASWTNCSIELEAETGAVQVEHLTFTTMDVSATTGSVYIDTCVATAKAIIGTTTGSAYVEMNAPKVTVGATTGSVHFEGEADQVACSATTGSVNVKCDAQNVTLGATTGSIKFDVSGAKTITAKCTTGTIKGEIDGNKNDWTIFVSTGTGSSNLQNKSGDGVHSLDVSTTTGSISVKFN